MKKVYLLILIALFANILFAQTYPEVSIRDIQFVGDKIASAPADYASPYEGDTVTTTGIVMHEVFIGGDASADYVIHSGGPTVFIQDPNESEWGGILVRRTYDLSEEENAVFALLDSGMVVKVTGIVSDYPSPPGQTQLNLIKFEASDVVGVEVRPKPILITLDSLLQQGTNQPIYTGEKWENMYVEIRNVTANHGLSTGGFSFGISDNNNLNLIVDDKSSYFSSQAKPLEGTKIESIRGMIGNRTNINPPYFLIDPIYPDDITYGDVFPPRIYNIERDIVEVKFGNEVTINSNIKDEDGTVESAQLIYYVNDVYTGSVDMSKDNDSSWFASLPAFNDSSFISYYLHAMDNEGIESNSPTDTVNGRFFYFVLDRPLTIHDVQYSPYGTGYSGYNNYSVTVEGTVTADTSNIPGDGSSGAQVYIQNGSGAWSGIQLFGTETEALVINDKVSVSGIINETFGVTRIGNLDEGVQITIIGNDGTGPEAIEVATSTIGTSSGNELPAESYEGVLLKYVGVSVINENADGDAGYDEGTGNNRNYGELLIADGTGVETRVELQDGGHNYHNFWDAALENEPIRILETSTFDELVGILYYSFGNYKLLPRSNDDFVGYTDIEENIAIPEVFSLSQNYPNPFNPTTVITYSIPEVSNVKLKVYDMLGREIKTLVNKEQNAGVYNIEFNAANLSSGVYFYKIEAGSFVASKKILLLK
jgi:Secretion system C-terminal sorting domain